MSAPPDRRRLDSWKEIAAYLGRTVRTVQRWERDEGLPVRRHVHQKLSSIYAYTDEIDHWWTQRGGLLATAQAAGDRTSTTEAVPTEPVPTPPSPALVGASSPAASAPSPGVALRLGPRTALLAASICVVLMVFGAVSFWRDGLVSAALAPGPDATRVPAPDADQHYRRGRAFWQQRTPRGFEQALQSFEAALAANPSHARAHAGLADTYTLLESFGLMSPAAALGRARAEAERAVQLEPGLGEAHASLAIVLWEAHDTAAAMAEMQRALELDPGYATAHHWYGLFLQQFLRPEEAIAEARRAVALDPGQPVFWTDLASMLKSAQRIDEAEAVLREARERHQGFPEIYIQLADLAQARGDADQAVTLLRRAVALGDNRARIVSRLGCLEGTTGHAHGATEALHLLRDMQASGHHVPDDALAALLAWTGDLDGAFHHIRRGLDQRQDWVAGLYEAAGCFEPLRRDSRWPALAAEIARASWLPLGSRPRPAAAALAPTDEQD
jgi:tetratricopeptide (TPR) repeat protein